MELLQATPYEIRKYAASHSGRIRLNKDIFSELVRVAKEGFGSRMSAKEVRMTVRPSTELFTAHKDNRTVGFTASQYKTNEVYLVAAVIVPSERGKGLYTVFNRLRIEGGLDRGITIFTTRTQNPIVERRITNVLETLKAEARIDNYTINRQPVIGIYGRMLTENRPISYDANIDKEFSRLDYERGDAYFITFSVQSN